MGIPCISGIFGIFGFFQKSSILKSVVEIRTRKIFSTEPVSDAPYALANFDNKWNTKRSIRGVLRLRKMKSFRSFRKYLSNVCCAGL